MPNLYWHFRIGFVWLGATCDIMLTSTRQLTRHLVRCNASSRLPIQRVKSPIAAAEHHLNNKIYSGYKKVLIVYMLTNSIPSKQNKAPCLSSQDLTINHFPLLLPALHTPTKQATRNNIIPSGYGSALSLRLCRLEDQSAPSRVIIVILASEEIE